MNVIEVNKYPPRLYKKGRWRNEDWFSIGHIGQTFAERTLTVDVYRDAEDRYIRAVNRYMAAASIVELRAHKLELWEPPPTDRTLKVLGLDDVFDQRPAPQEGEALSGERLENAIRRCLREGAWLEFMIPGVFLLHIAYDFRIVIATTADVSVATAETRLDGLFVYKYEGNIRTLREWTLQAFSMPDEERPDERSDADE